MCYNLLLEKISDRNEIEHKAWLVQLHFCAMRDAKDVRYLREDLTFVIEKLEKPRKNELHLLQSRYLSSPKAASSMGILSLRRFVLILSRKCSRYTLRIRTKRMGMPSVNKRKQFRSVAPVFTAGTKCNIYGLRQ